MRAESAVEPTKVGEHHRHLAALGAVFGRCAWGTRRGRCVNGGRLAARVAAQSSDGIEQLHAVPECRDAKLLQVLVRQARKNRLVYLVLAECRLVLSEAQAPQPDHDVHDGAHNSGLLHIIVRSGRVSRRFRDGWFSVSISVGVKTVPRSAATYPVPISARGTIGNCAKISVSDHRDGLCHQDRLGAR